MIKKLLKLSAKALALLTTAALLGLLSIVLGIFLTVQYQAVPRPSVEAVEQQLLNEIKKAPDAILDLSEVSPQFLTVLDYYNGTKKRTYEDIHFADFKTNFIYNDKTSEVTWKDFLNFVIELKRSEIYIPKKTKRLFYINCTDFNKNMHGIKTASLFFFNKTYKEINYAEAIFLLAKYDKYLTNKEKILFYETEISNFAKWLHIKTNSNFKFNKHFKDLILAE